jgi:hypothetical protein
VGECEDDWVEMRLSEELREQKTNTENSVSCTTSLCNPVSDRSKEYRYFSLGHGATTKTPSSGPVRIGTKRRSKKANAQPRQCTIPQNSQEIKAFHSKGNGKKYFPPQPNSAPRRSLSRISKELEPISSIELMFRSSSPRCDSDASYHYMHDLLSKTPGSLSLQWNSSCWKM